MKGKPFAAAIVAFLLVFLGGAAIAGVNGAFVQEVSAPATGGNDEVEKSTTSTTKAPDTEKLRHDLPTDKKDAEKEPVDKKKTDSTPPLLTITSPTNGSHVDTDVIVISGGVEPGAKVLLGDRKALVEGDSWKIEVELEKGKNLFRFKAFDEAGNHSSRGVIVFYDQPEEKEDEDADTTPPRFSITSPADGSETHDKVIRVKGAVEPGAKVYHGDRKAHVDGDNWKIDVELKKGKNVLTFKAKDRAGNRTTRSITVWYVGDGDTTPPHFTITSPDDGSETDDRVILVKGGVEPGAKVYYGDRKAHVDGDNWKIEVELKKGENVLTFKAYDEAGNKTKRSVTVWYLGDDDHTYEFWAAQKYGSCGEEIPYDIFYGEGKPGSVVEVGSDYGSGRVEVGESGHWEIKVTFEGSPVGETFNVTVDASTGESKKFTFTNTGGEH
ncbi:MAG: hypothetical protein DWP92_00815 [Armatimonadetes bacterium]|nr:MAG: hypothetical protein DWP92_00815 [Armatimonadota bacterium]